MKHTRFAKRWLLVFLFACTASSFAQHQNPNGVFPLATTNEPYLFLVRDPIVHKDLELSEEQQAKLTAVNDKADRLMWTMRNKQPQQLVKIMEQATKETKTSLKQFLNKQQYRRILEIELWVLGMKGLMRDNIAKYLKLESQQRDDIKQILVDAAKTKADLQQKLNNGGNADELNQKFRDVQTNEQKDIVALLTEDQKQKWIKALGKQVDTNQLGRIKFKAPEITSDNGWVNSDPLSMEQLKGKVVALHFYAFH